MTGNPSAPTEFPIQAIFNRSWDSRRNVLKTADFGLAVAMGLIPGTASINKFGRNIEIDAGILADIWDGGHTLASGGVSLLWLAPTQPRVHALVSTSDEDSDSGGTNPQGGGARTLRLFGLEDWDTAESSEDIIMDGTNPVNTTKSYVIMHRMFVTSEGATSINVGVITATAASDSTVTAQIRVGQGQTQMAIYGIPSTQKAYMFELYATANKAGGATGLADVSLLVNLNSDIESLNFVTRHTFGLQTVGTSVAPLTFNPPKEIPGPAIIKLQVLSGTNDMDISAGFDMVLVDN